MVTKAQIQLVRSLADKQARRETGLFVVEGVKMIREALASSFCVERLYAGEGVVDAFGQELRQGMAEAVSAKELERLSHLRTPSQAVALVRMPENGGRAGEEFGEELALCLDNVQDPGNLGTILRVADWFGIGEVLCSPDSADCYNSKVVQATMGAIFRVRVRYAPVAEALAGAVRRGVPVYGTFLEGEDIYRAELTQRGVIVMGNEGRGIGAETAACVTRKLFVPPFPAERHGSESLNVAVATAVVCAEFRRRMR